MRAIYFIVSVFLTLLISEGYSATKAGKVIEVSGKTDQLRLERIDKKFPLYLDDPLFFMDTVLTGNLSTARLHLTPESNSDVKLFVYENSELKIEPDLLKAGKRHFVAKFNRGLMRFIAKGLKKNNEELRLNLPNCVVGVRGTEGEVSATQGPFPEEGKIAALFFSMIFVDFFEGVHDQSKVEVTANQGTTKEQTVVVGPGQTAVVSGPPGEATITIKEDGTELVAGGEIDDVAGGEIGDIAGGEIDNIGGVYIEANEVASQAFDMSRFIAGLLISCRCTRFAVPSCGVIADLQNDCKDFNG